MNLVQNVLFRATSRIEQVNRVLRFALAGTLQLDDLRSEVERYWNTFKLDSAEETAGLRPWEREIVSRFVCVGDSVLVIGCGAGRDLLPLIEMGCSVTGVEPAARAVATAKRTLAECRLSGVVLHGFIEDVSLTGAFDVINFSDFCYSLIASTQRRVEVLRKAVRHLNQGGRILITAFLTGAHRDTRSQAIARALGRWRRSDWVIERGDRLSSMVEDGRLFWNFSHEFTVDELRSELSEAGLQIVYRHPHVPAFVLTIKADERLRVDERMTASS